MMRMMKMSMTLAEVTVTLENLVTMERVKSLLDHREWKNARISDSWNDFQKQSQYLDMLIKVNESGHKVHDEIDEALKKLKEITYQ
jgi:hypothetical protein